MELQDIAKELEDVPIKFLEEITDDFSEERKLGEGAFGVVYRGVTKNGDNVAVKKLSIRNVSLDYEKFKNEFFNLTKLIRHQNIVQILGYCYEIKEKPYIMPDGRKVSVDEPYTALCFEYMHNGSLEEHLSDELCGLHWHIRFKIIKGICEGLKYMHKLEEPIWHLDLKPDNILLDKDMVPKIADFGLSRIIGKEPKRITNNPYGTLGYQPPEYIDKCEISGKFDIFSLGVVIIKIVSGPKGYPNCLDMSSEKFIHLVQKNWRNRLQPTCNTDSELEAYCRQIKTCIEIALNSVDKDGQKRPDIVDITKKLNEVAIETDQLLHQGFHETVSKMTKDVSGQEENTNLRSGTNCKVLEFFDARETSSDIIGRKEEKKGVVTSLFEKMSKKFIILPIYGIGGIGKTTFARLIYNDPKFKCFSQVWVDVPERFDLNIICECISSQLPKKKISGEKIFIVLDDLWEDNQFQLQELKGKLYHDNSTVVTLVTTRSKRVAERICTNLQPYKILPLTNDMCWNIIKQKSGFDNKDDKEQLMNIGQEIAKKCGGVALAAQTLGFTLRSMDFDQWMNVKDSDIWNEVGSKDFPSPNHVLASLKLSYSYMPPLLKPCFTYCAIFPKGHKISKDDLMYQWISLDFIKPKKLLSSIELCEDYIAQLLGLSFFRHLVSPKTFQECNEQATFFTMHDLVHDLAIWLLGNQILDQSKQGITLGSNYQYALLTDCSKPLDSFTTSPDTLIALRFLDGCRSKLSSVVYATARSLRILDLSQCSIEELPDSIGQLTELRYLNAPKIQNQMVPENITKLSNLIYLNLHKSSILALPQRIGEMKGLMHLNLSGCNEIIQLPSSFRNLKNLVHLDYSDCSLSLDVSRSLEGLSRLEHLSLSYCCITKLPRALIGLTALQCLNLKNVFCLGSFRTGLLVMAIHTKLRYLSLEGCLDTNIEHENAGSDVRLQEEEEKAECDVFLQLISRLSNLEYLNLGWNKSLYRIPETIGNLSKLVTLDLSYCHNLRELPASICEIQSLKFLHVIGCLKLDKSTLPQYKNGALLLPLFVVHTGDGESSSNLSQLEYENPNALEIIQLEKVTSAEEAQRIKLVEKQRLQKLELVWTRDAERLVDDDKEILENLVPPETVEEFMLQGYNCVTYPSWMLDVATYLPCLTKMILRDLPNCDKLPPLGQLPNLVELRIGRMDSIRKIDSGLYGCTGAFPRLESFYLDRMECLEEWNTEYSSGQDSLNELVFPNLVFLLIEYCPKLRFKSCPPLAKKMSIIASHEVMLSSWGDRGQVGAPFYAPTTILIVSFCEAPLQQWSLLRHLPYLKQVWIRNCCDLTCSSTDLLRCFSSLETLSVTDSENCTLALPEWLGDLTSLTQLSISNCKGIKTLPQSIRKLTCLQRLEINSCPDLVQWCKSRENQKKLAHIKEIILNHSRFSLACGEAKN